MFAVATKGVWLTNSGNTANKIKKVMEIQKVQQQKKLVNFTFFFIMTNK